MYRWRSYLPLPLLGLALLAAWQGPALPVEWELACLSLGVCGLLVRCWAIGFAGAGTSGRSCRSQQADELNTTGLYSVMRNPLYLGNYMMWMSVAIVTRTYWLPLVGTGVFFVCYRLIIRAEEAFLRNRFGHAFYAWASVTPAFIPDFRRWRPADGKFALRRVLKSERSSLVSLVIAFSALHVLSKSRMTERISMHGIWIGLLLSAVLIYAGVEMMKKREKNRRKKESATRAAADSIESSLPLAARRLR
jgi:protein-S-isoprenylcysteine O-methyltransferase Ste14